MKVLIVGPSPTRSKGGMATVIEEIEKDKMLNSQFKIDIFESYIDGNKLKVLLYSIFAFLKFYFTKKIMIYIMFMLHHMEVHLERDFMSEP